MEKKTIQIDKNLPKSVLIGIVLAFVTVFAVEHFSSFSRTPNLNIPSTDSNGKIILSGTYNPTTTPVGALYQTTSFGIKIDLPTTGMMSSELLYDSDFKRYSNKGILYAKAVFNDYEYLLLIWFVYAMIILFFKKYSLKVLILILPIILISCENKVAQKKGSVTTIQSDSVNQNSQFANNTPNSQTTQIKHSFVVFKVKDNYLGKESVIVTGIFNTPYTISTDEEYMILDDTQSKCNAYLFDKNILERYMMRFGSYAEASQEKERILKINSTTRSQNNQYKEEYDLLMIDSVSVGLP